jgi:hypothetical protein
MQSCRRLSEGSGRVTNFYELDAQVKGKPSLEESLVSLLNCTMASRAHAARQPCRNCMDVFLMDTCVFCLLLFRGFQSMSGITCVMEHLAVFCLYVHKVCLQASCSPVHVCK